jgi:hypothetical protein
MSPAAIRSVSATDPARRLATARAPRPARPGPGRVAPMLLAGAILALAPLPALAKMKKSPFPQPHPTKEWNQAEVTALAQQLAQAAQKVYTAYLDTSGPGLEIGSGQAVDSMRLNNDLQILQQMTAALAGALEKGKGRIETTPQFEDIGEKARDGKMLLGFLFEQDQLIQSIDAARAIWIKLQPYYGVPEPKMP